jgi:hypothetical protein
MVQIFLMNDQPTICSISGPRCEDLATFMHTNAQTLLVQCLNPDCSFIFFEEEDEEFLTL